MQFCRLHPNFHLYSRGSFTQLINQLKPCYFRNYAKIAISSEERAKLLKALSSFSVRELSNLKISPQSIKKILSERKIAGEFTSLKDLHMCGFDDSKLHIINKELHGKELYHEELINSLKAPLLYSLNSEPTMLSGEHVETISMKDNEHLSKHKLKKSKTSLVKVRKLVDTVKKKIPKDLNSVTALDCSFSKFAWTTISMDQKILDMSCLNLISNEDQSLQSLDVHYFYDMAMKDCLTLLKISLNRDIGRWSGHLLVIDASDFCERSSFVASAVKSVPTSDLYIIEDVAPTSRDIYANRLYFTLRGILLVLLDVRSCPTSPHTLLYVKNSIMSRLFDLKVGNERKSGLSIGEEIIIGRSKPDWLRLIEFEKLSLQKYVLSEYQERRHMINSMLLAIAFDSVFIKEDNLALMKIVN